MYSTESTDSGRQHIFTVLTAIKVVHNFFTPFKAISIEHCCFTKMKVLWESLFIVKEGCTKNVEAFTATRSHSVCCATRLPGTRGGILLSVHLISSKYKRG